MNRKYCDDAECSNFIPDGNCRLGFILKFRVPKSMTDVQNNNWGYLMPRACRQRIKKVEKLVKEI